MKVAALRWSALAGAIALAAVTTGCATSTPDIQSAPEQGQGAAFPRTVQGAGIAAVTIPSEPERIAVLSVDAAEAVLALTGPERVVAVPQDSTNPTLGNHVDAAAAVPNKLPAGTSPDPELVLSHSPDLIVLTSRHGGEKDAGAALGSTGVPVLAISNNWDSFATIQQNITVLGQALGAETTAARLVADMRAQEQEIADKLAGVDTPAVLALTNQASTPFIAGPDSFTSALITAAGAELAATRAGLTTTGRADPELVVRAQPDAILLVDVLGRGRQSFDSLLSSQAVAALPAVADDRILLLPARVAFGSGTTHTVDGLRQVAHWLHPGRV